MTIAKPKQSAYQIQQNRQKTIQRRKDIKKGKTSDLKTIQQNRINQIGAQQPFSLEGFKNNPNDFDFTQQRQQLEDRAYQRFADVNEPMFQNQQTEFEQQMRDRGIAPGSELYDRMSLNLSRQQNDARQSARQQALAFGGQETERAFNLGSGAREQAVNEYQMGRQSPYQDLASVLAYRGALKDINAPRGGGGPAQPALTPQQEMDMQTEAYRQRRAIDAQYAGGNKPSTGQQLGSITSGILGGLAIGAGRSIFG